MSHLIDIYNSNRHSTAEVNDEKIVFREGQLGDMGGTRFYMISLK